jgi:hypothetical protein
MRCQGAVDTWLQQRAADPCSDQAPRHVALATTNIEERPIGVKRRTRLMGFLTQEMSRGK